MSLVENAQLSFATTLSSIEDGEVILREVHGVERLSTPYEFDLTFECTREGGFPTDVIDELLAAEVNVGFGSLALRRVSGVLREIELTSIRDDERASIYRAVLVPRFWRTTLVHRSRCFVGEALPAIFRAVLEEHGFVEGQDFELRIAEDEYPADEDRHVVQYEETDFNFLSRWMERLGLFYYFEQTDSGEILVITDSNKRLVPDAEHHNLEHSVEYSYDTDIHDPGQLGLVRRLTRARPALVHVRDYGWRSEARTDLVHGDAPVDDAAGYGIQSYYGRHAATDDAAKARAKIRAEEWMAGKHVYTAASVMADFWPGQRVALSGAPVPDLDLEYLLTAVVHEATHGPGGGSYANRVEMIDFRVPYRAPRRARWPRIDGVMHARVDHGQVSSVAPIDARGRYRVVLPYDLYGTYGERPSCWVRKAEGYAGPRQGIHFTLHAGTEVLLAHIDGDPDRPIIVGSVPNDADVSPTTSDEARRHIIRTRSGIVFDFQDDAT